MNNNGFLDSLSVCSSCGKPYDGEKPIAVMMVDDVRYLNGATRQVVAAIYVHGKCAGNSQNYGLLLKAFGCQKEVLCRLS